MMDPNVNEVMIAAREKASKMMEEMPLLTREAMHAALVLMYCDAYRDALKFSGALVRAQAAADAVIARRMPHGSSL